MSFRFVVVEVASSVVVVDAFVVVVADAFVVVVDSFVVVVTDAFVVEVVDAFVVVVADAFVVVVDAFVVVVVVTVVVVVVVSSTSFMITRIAPSFRPTWSSKISSPVTPSPFRYLKRSTSTMVPPLGIWSMPSGAQVTGNS